MPKNAQSTKRLTKGNDKMLSGVLSGVATYFNLDPTLVRLAYVLLTVFTGFFPLGLAYVVAALVIPNSKNS